MWWQLDEVCPLRQLYSFSLQYDYTLSRILYISGGELVNVEGELYFSIERQVVKYNNLIITINRTNCGQQILSFKTTFQIRKGRQTALTFVEFQKAYDSIHSHPLFNILEEFKVDRKTRELIKHYLISFQKLNFQTVPEPFDIKSGL